MAKLAIKGDKKRGKQIIKLLETLGGKNTYELHGKNDVCAYIIEPTPESDIECRFLRANGEWKVFTIDSFLCSFPYNVGDKVIFNGNVELINRMRWDGETIKYGFFTTKWIREATARDLQPYKEQEEIMDKKKKEVSFEYKVVEKEVELVIPDGIELSIQDGRVLLRDKKPKYPKTYEECCKVLLLKPERATYSVSGLEYKRHLIVNLQRLIICRDAYWKIAGDWEPDVMYCDLYCIGYDGNVVTWKMQGGCRLLVFPTEEMRDAFYENFKGLIESCKELL